DLVPPPVDRPADELLVAAEAVHVGGVEEEDSELERPVDRRDRLLLVGRPIERRHPHAPEALRGDLEALSERTHVHQATPPGGSFRVRTRLGCGIVWSSRSGRIAVPTAKNSITCEPQPWLRSCSCTATIPSASSVSASACMRSIASSRAS